MDKASSNMICVSYLRIALQGTKPPIWRRLAVAADITLGWLHEAIQIVMGWTNTILAQWRGKD